MHVLVVIIAVSLFSACSHAVSLSRGPEVEESIERIVTDLRTELVVRDRSAPPTFSLTDRMAQYRVPGVSIAVVEDGRIAWARGFGVTVAGTSDPVTPATLFQAASISKPIAATAMLRMVDEGALDLDTPVNRYLGSWKLPDNRFTTEEQVTLRRLASHGAGLTIHGFPGYRPGDPIPSVPEILDGSGSANTEAVRVDTIPGSVWRYSGGGVTIEQLILTDVTGEPFPALMNRLVLGPAGMTSSTFEQPLPVSRRSAAAAGHRSDGTTIPGRWHVYPEMAAAGLWTTPTDLLRWAIEIAASRAGQSTKLLSRPLAEEMLRPQKGTSGLGPTLGGRGAGFHFGHGGSNAGFRARLIYFPETGQGAAVMTNGDGGDPLLREILLSIGAAYDWPDYVEVEAVAMDSSALGRFVGEYAVSQPYQIVVEVTRQGERLFKEASPLLGAREEIVFVDTGRAVGLQSGNEYVFGAAADGRIDRMELVGLTLERRLRRSRR